MELFARAEGPEGGIAGWRVVAGRETGLQRVMLVMGCLPRGDYGPVHLHRGDEVLRLLTGEMLIRLGEERRVCRAGDVVVVPPDTLHGFRALAETTLEVIAEYDIGTLYPVYDARGGQQLVEVFRKDMPWGRVPPDGHWTTDEALRELLANLAVEV